MTDKEMFERMASGKPYKSYIKTILGAVVVFVLDQFSGKEKELIIQGNPRGKERENCIIDVWNQVEDLYFKRTNRRQLETGYVIEYTRTEKDEAGPSPNEVSDEDLVTILNSKFMSLQASVNKFTSVAPIVRLIDKAKELEKSDKIVKFLEGKLSELQLKDYQPDEE